MNVEEKDNTSMESKKKCEDCNGTGLYIYYDEDGENAYFCLTCYGTGEENESE